MPWLVLTGRLGARSDGESELVFNPSFCNVTDMGFSNSAHAAITERPPRPGTVPYDNWCNDRSLIVRPDDTVRTAGQVEICGGFIYDSRYRGDIDFTGIKVTISLRGDAYEDDVQYIGKAKMPELTDRVSWAGVIVFRLPSPRFVFPMPRGSSRPWDNENIVGTLKPIRRFNFDYIEVQQLRATPNGGITAEQDLGIEQTGLKPALAWVNYPIRDDGGEGFFLIERPAIPDFCAHFSYAPRQWLKSLA